ncbi:S-adenosyl-L-methionine-dependent methyltransferase [Trametes sanguinea]|nr:S-adenosyl-L-methionine-dependent methyltransferase [Trametes sanguinea]
MTFSTLRALHALIGEAIDDLERLYAERSEPSDPLDFPSLDEPYYADAKHTSAQERAETMRIEPDVSFATQRIVAACDQMSATVNRPWFGLGAAVQGGQLAACIGFMEAAHIVEILREAGSPQGLHVQDIYRLIMETRPSSVKAEPGGLAPHILSHILRTLATPHWIREVSPDVFANNRRSSFIDSGTSLAQLRADPSRKYVNTNGASSLAGFCSDEILKIMGTFSEWLLPDIAAARQPDEAALEETVTLSKSYRSQTSNIDAVRYPTPFSLAFDTDMGYFAWLDLPENQSRLERFGHMMTGTRFWETKDEALHGFPWAELPPEAVLVDVGGGIGSTSLAIAQAHPNIHIVVEDRPQVIDMADSAWGNEYADLRNSGRVNWRSRDFMEDWEPLPSGQAPDAFLLRLVLHDWPDEDARRILRQLRKGAGPRTKLIIGDMLLLHACHNTDSKRAAPDSPLLSNMGVANIQNYLIDNMASELRTAQSNFRSLLIAAFQMTAMFASMERTEDEMARLLLSAGWEMAEVRRSPGAIWAYSTAIPV